MSSSFRAGSVLSGASAAFRYFVEKHRREGVEISNIILQYTVTWKKKKYRAHFFALNQINLKSITKTVIMASLLSNLTKIFNILNT